MPVIPEGHNLFVIDLEYCVPLETASPHLDAHVEFLEKFYANGTFLASGPKVPRTGGCILAVARGRDHIEKIITEDVFHQLGHARYSITEFIANRRHRSLQ